VTEGEWLACTDPKLMLEFLQGTGKSSDRKLRLFAVACCRRFANLIPDPRSRTALTVAEQYADGLATAESLKTAETEASQVSHHGYPEERLGTACYDAATYYEWNLSREEMLVSGLPTCGQTAAENASEQVAHYCGFSVEVDTNGAAHSQAFRTERQSQAEMLRDIVGNPFRPVAVDASWLTPTVLGLAQSIYGERRLDQLPSLAEALENAGCHNADILAHCRQPGGHVRGCWVLDTILEKN
jgi:hypothetical protein